MTEAETRARIAEYEAAHRQVKICWGGDGTVLAEWRKAKSEKRALLPVRNYAQCPAHAGFLEDLLAGRRHASLKEDGIKMTLHQLARCEFAGYDELALSEVFVTSADPTEALRFDVVVNGEKYLGGVIATAFMAATPFGATGYWSSATRTIFREGLGIAFIAPTVGVSNLVLKPTDKAEIVFARRCEAKVAADKLVKDVSFKAGDSARLELSPDNVAVFGLAQFHCNDCRAGRSGTVLSNQYLK